MGQVQSLLWVQVPFEALLLLPQLMHIRCCNIHKEEATDEALCEQAGTFSLGNSCCTLLSVQAGKFSLDKLFFEALFELVGKFSPDKQCFLMLFVQAGDRKFQLLPQYLSLLWQTIQLLPSKKSSLRSSSLTPYSLKEHS